MDIKIINKFSSPQNDDKVSEIGHWLSSNNLEIPIFEITSFYLLTQFVGYAKYANRKYGDVYYRGQSSLYAKSTIYKQGIESPFYQSSLLPSLFRGERVVNKVFPKISAKIKVMQKKNADLKGMCDEKLFPLLQHYGIKTQWLDLVDNLWVALWFATHDFVSTNLNHRQFVQAIEKNDGFVYLFLVLSDATKNGEDSQEPGVYKGNHTTLVDLRKALPSFYLRPHAQHAYMIKKNNFLEDADYSDLLTAIVAIPTENAMSWIGKSGLLSVQSLFPSPYNDCGYKKLLGHVKIVDNPTAMDLSYYGAINLIGNDYF